MIQLTMPQFCACLNPTPEFPLAYTFGIMVLYVINDLKSEAVILLGNRLGTFAHLFLKLSCRTL